MLETLQVTQKVENASSFGFVVNGDGLPDLVNFYTVRLLPQSKSI